MVTNNQQNPNNTQNINEENIKNIVELQESLGRVSDIYKEINKTHKLNSTELKNINSLTTQLNNILKDTATLEAKIGSEFIKRKNIDERINILKGKQTEIDTRLANISKGRTQGELEYIEEFTGWIDKAKELSEEAQKAFDVGKMDEYTDKMNEVYRLEEDIQLFASEIVNLGFKEIMILKEQKAISEKTAEMLEAQLVIIEKGNKEFQRRNILQALGNKLLSGSLKDMYSVFEKLGGRGVVS